MNTTRQLILETTTRICADHATRIQIDAVAEGQWPAPLWDALFEAGLPLAPASTTSGDLGLSLADAYAPLRVLGRFAAPVPLAQALVAAQLLSDAGVELPSGITGLAYVAPDADESLRVGGDTLKGTLSAVPFGRHLQSLLIVLNEGERSRQFLVTSKENIEIETNVDAAGEPADDLHFAGTAAVLVADEPTQKPLMLLALTRVLLMTGALESVLEMSVEYALERQQFGRPIARFQAIQQQLAVAAGEVAAAVRASDAALEALDSPLLSTEVAIAKARVGEAAGQVSEIAHQVHGAIGFTYEHSLHYRTRRLWVWRDQMGHEADWQLQLGRAVAAQGADAFWEFIVHPGPL